MYKKGDKLIIYTHSRDELEKVAKILDDVGKWSVSIMRMVQVILQQHPEGVYIRVNSDNWCYGSNNWKSALLDFNNYRHIEAKDFIKDNQLVSLNSIEKVYQDWIDNYESSFITQSIIDIWKNRLNMNYAMSLIKYDASQWLPCEPHKSPLKTNKTMNIIKQIKDLKLTKEARILREQGFEDENGKLTKLGADMMLDELLEEKWAERKMDVAKNLLEIKALDK